MVTIGTTGTDTITIDTITGDLGIITIDTEIEHITLHLEKHATT